MVSDMDAHRQGEAARTAPRHKIFEKTVLRVGQTEVPVHVLNLSATGALLHGIAPPVGATAELELGTSVVRGRIVWTKGPRFGLCFLPALGDAQVGDFLRACAAQFRARGPAVS